MVEKGKDESSIDDDIEKIKKVLVERGYDHYEGQIVQGEEPHFFIKGKKLINIIANDWADEEIIDSIKQLK